MFNLKQMEAFSLHLPLLDLLSFASDAKGLVESVNKAIITKAETAVYPLAIKEGLETKKLILASRCVKDWSGILFWPYVLLIY